MQNQKSR